MSKIINWTECRSCNWKNKQSKSQSYYNLCKLCNNSGLVPDPKDILCNSCGGSMRPLGTMNEQYSHGLEAKVGGGYDSYHLFDMTSYEFKICEKCLRNMFNNFAIPPTVVDTLGDPQHLYEQDKHAYDYRVWKDDGGHHQAYLNKLCNSAKNCPNTAIYTIFHSEKFSEDTACEEHKSFRLYSNSRLNNFISDNLKVFL
jgi:hypothetical protein